MSSDGGRQAGAFTEHRLVLGTFAAALLTWGLAGAQVHHQLTAHRDVPVLAQPRSLPLKAAKKKHAARPHHHGAPTRHGHRHGGESLEHGKALLLTPAPAPELHLVLAERVRPADDARAAPDLFTRHRTEQPQGP